MKIIFLDIDGVLNTSKTFKDINNEYKKTGIRRIEIDLERVEYLKEIVEKTGAEIVLSSSWRVFCTKENDIVLPQTEQMKEFFQILNNYGLTIYDITPRSKDRIRQNEIYTWMLGKNIDSFIVLDDDPYDLQDFVSKELIKTSFIKDNEMIKNMDDCCGLCKSHIETAIKLLNKNDRKLIKLK